MSTRYRNPYKVNYKKYEPYYSCSECGEKFNDSNDLCSHRSNCRYRTREKQDYSGFAAKPKTAP